MAVPRNPIKFMWFILKKSRKWAILAVLAVLCAEIMEGVLLLFIRELTDSATAAVSTGFDQSSLKSLWFWVIVFPIGFLISESVWRLSGFSGMRLITQSEANSTRVLFEYLIEHSRNYFNNKFAGSLTNKIGHASRGVDSIFGTVLWHYFPLLVGLTIDLTIALTISYILGLVLFVWIVIFLVINYIMVRKKQYLSYANADANSVMKGKMVDTVSNISAVQANAYQKFERSFVGRYIDKRQKAHLKSWLASEWILLANGLLLAIITFAMLAITIWQMQSSDVSLGSLVLIITMVIGLMRSLFFIGSKMTDTIDDYSQIEEGLNELVIPYDITDKKGARILKKSKGSLDFKNVSFNFDRTQVFKDFVLNIKAGQRVGLVGVSGAGKTTFVNLLMRHFDVKKGSISIDGRDIRDITRESLRKQIAFVPQDVSLFHRTIKDNIRYGNLKASEDDVIEAAKKAQADEFIMSFEKGYDTYVGERGVKLSGGQRQRIAIARAFLKSAPILVLDEATSSLDSESEVAVQAALGQLIQGRTVIAIAHRLSTLRVMDRIVVLEKGKIAEDGTHDFLIKKDGIYAQLWKHQVKGFIVG